MSDASASLTPQDDRNLTSIADEIDDPARSAMLAALAGGRALRIDLAALRASRRIFARSCVDWTDRRVHLAGTLPAAITSEFLDRGWLTRGPGRGLRVDDDFDDDVEKWLAT